MTDDYLCSFTNKVKGLSGIGVYKMPGDFVAGYTEETEKVVDAIRKSGIEPVNIAIFSEPFAGKTTFLNHIYAIFRGRGARISISHSDDISYLKQHLKDIRESIIFIDDCHLLYDRKVDGFEELKDLLDFIGESTEKIFITSWNIFSWNYLNKTHHIEKHFPCRIELPEFGVEQIRSVLLDPYISGDILFESGEKNGIEHVLEFKSYTLNLKRMDKKINIPYPNFHYNLLKEKLSFKKKATPDELAFTKIKENSSGNILLSKIIWEKSLQGSTIRVTDIYSPSYEVKLEYDTLFIGFLILSMGNISKKRLESTIGDEIDITRSLSLLLEHKIIRIKDGICSIRPEAMHHIGSLARNRRLL